jgi:hypothetical protein
MESTYSSCCGQSCSLCFLFTIKENVQALLERRPVTLFLVHESLNVRASKGCPFSQMCQDLLEATTREHIALLDRLVASGANLNAIPGWEGSQIALQWAATRGEPANMERRLSDGTMLEHGGESAQINKIRFQRVDGYESSDLRLISISIDNEQLGYFAVCTFRGIIIFQQSSLNMYLTPVGGI